MRAFLQTRRKRSPARMANKTGQRPWAPRVIGVLTVVLSACASATRTSTAQSVTPPRTAEVALPANVISVPFEWVDDRLYFPAEVEGHAGHVFLDTGAPFIGLNPMHMPSPMYAAMTVRIDTVTVHVRPNKRASLPFVGISIGYDLPRRVEKRTNREFLAILGVNFMERFETVVDYTRQRLVFIPLDSAGHRLVPVPSYTPATVMRMWSGHADTWYIKAQVGDVANDSLMLDTGTMLNELTESRFDAARSHLTPAGTNERFGFPQAKLDHLVFAGHPFNDVLFTRTSSESSVVGNLLMSKLGVVGFNFRAGEFVQYR